MVRPEVADRGDGLQIRKVAAYILNKQSQTADSGWCSSLGVRQGANNAPHHKKGVPYKTFHTASELDGFSAMT
jgi:hypothetical protein